MRKILLFVFSLFMALNTPVFGECIQWQGYLQQTKYGRSDYVVIGVFDINFTQNGAKKTAKTDNLTRFDICVDPGSDVKFTRANWQPKTEKAPTEATPYGRVTVTKISTDPENDMFTNATIQANVFTKYSRNHEGQAIPAKNYDVQISGIQAPQKTNQNGFVEFKNVNMKKPKDLIFIISKDDQNYQCTQTTQFIDSQGNNIQRSVSTDGMQRTFILAFNDQQTCKPTQPSAPVAKQEKGLTITGKITPKPKPTTRVKIKYQLMPTGENTEEQSEADGSFTITGVKPNTKVTFSYDGYEDATCTPRTSNDCKTIQLQKDKTDTITVTGTILDDAQKPVSGAQITVIDKNGTITKNTDKSDKKGQFKLKKVPKDAKIQVSADYYHQQTLDVSENMTVTLQQNTVTKPNDPCKSTNGTGTWQKVKSGGNLKCVITDCNAIEGKTLKVNADKTDCEEVETNAPQTETEPDEEKVEKAKQSQKEYELAREKEKAGRVNAGLSTFATGLGGYAAVSSYFEQEADKKAEEDMRDYLSHMSCDYSGGGVASLGETVEIPGGDELFDYYNQYRNLANNLKQTKAALNLTPGLEAQVVYENSNLYQYSSRTPRSGSTTSLARALMDENSEDAAAWNAQKEKTAQDLRTGALVAAGGLAFGISNRIALDKKYNKRFEKLREDFKKANEKFAAARDGVEVEELETRITDLETLTAGQDETIQAQALQIQDLQNQLAQNQIVDDDIAAEIAALTFNEQSIKFAPDEYQLNSAGKQALQDYATTVIIPTLDKHADIKLNITVVGHTDRTGNETTNQILSLNRAQSVATELDNLLTNYTNRVFIDHQGNGQNECGVDGNQPDCRKIVITIKAQVPSEDL